MLLNKEQRAKRGDEQGRSWEGRELTLGTWRSRGGAGPVEEEQDQRGAPRGLVGEEIGGAGEEKMRSRTCREVARRRGPAAGTTKSDSGTSEWCRAPFYPSRAFVSWPRARLAAREILPLSDLAR